MNNTVPFKNILAQQDNICIIEVRRTLSRSVGLFMEALFPILSFKPDQEEFIVLDSYIQNFDGLAFYNNLEWFPINTPDISFSVPEKSERLRTIAWDLLRDDRVLFTVVIISTMKNNFNYIIY